MMLKSWIKYLTIMTIGPGLAAWHTGQRSTMESVFMISGSMVGLPADLSILDLDIASMLPLSTTATAALGIPVEAIA